MHINAGGDGAGGNNGTMVTLQLLPCCKQWSDGISKLTSNATARYEQMKLV